MTRDGQSTDMRTRATETAQPNGQARTTAGSIGILITSAYQRTHYDENIVYALIDGHINGKHRLLDAEAACCGTQQLPAVAFE